MDREQYEKDLAKRQADHLKRVSERGNRNWKPCRHDGCSQCCGTGVKSDGSQCVHMLHCDCPRCQPYSMRVENDGGSAGEFSVDVHDFFGGMSIRLPQYRSEPWCVAR